MKPGEVRGAVHRAATFGVLDTVDEVERELERHGYKFRPAHYTSLTYFLRDAIDQWMGTSGLTLAGSYRGPEDDEDTEE